MRNLTLDDAAHIATIVLALTAVVTVVVLLLDHAK